MSEWISVKERLPEVKSVHKLSYTKTSYTCGRCRKCNSQ